MRTLEKETSRRRARGRSSGSTACCATRASATTAEVLALEQKSAQYIGQGGDAAEEAWFNALRNARVAVEGTRYFTEALSGTSSWNLRDQHMASTLDQLAAHLSPPWVGRAARVIDFTGE
jgi:erythromycin esterase-like protein